jgi:hypothetical protein
MKIFVTRADWGKRWIAFVSLAAVVAVVFSACPVKPPPDDDNPPAEPSWHYPTDLSDSIDPGGDYAFNPQVATDDKGDAVIVWSQGPAPRHIFKSERRNGVWTHPADSVDNISPDGQSADIPQVAMDNNGDAIIVWLQSDGAYNQVFKSECRGGVWTHPTDLSGHISPDGATAWGPQVAMGDDGSAIIVWAQGNGSNDQVFRSEYRGGVWTHPQGLSDNISPDGRVNNSPQVAIDDNGNALIVWAQIDGGNLPVFKSEYRAGIWADPADLSDHINPDANISFSWGQPQVAMDEDGNALIVWSQYAGAPGSRVFTSEYRASTWTHPVDLSDNLGGSASVIGPQVAMNINEKALIGCFNNNNPYITVYKSEYSSGSWTVPAVSSPGGQWDNSNSPPQVAMDESGDALIVWAQFGYDGLSTTTTQVFRSERRDGVWASPSDWTDYISLDGRAAIAPQAAMSNSGYSLVVWSASTNAGGIFMSEYY